jgi:hypothetical protein
MPSLSANVQEQLSADHKMPLSLCNLMFPTTDWEQMMHDDRVISKKLLDAIKAMQGDSLLFPVNELITKQYAQADCYAIAEHLLYALVCFEDSLKVSYMHVILSNVGVSAHGFIKVNVSGQDYFVDACGIFKNVEDIVSRYDLTMDDIVINEYTSYNIIEEGENDVVRQLTELTATYGYTHSLADIVGAESAEEVCEYAVYNVIDHLLNSLEKEKGEIAA